MKKELKFKTTGKTNTVHVNGMEIVAPTGANISVINGVVRVNGEIYGENGNSAEPIRGDIKVVISGDVDSIESSYGDVEVGGNTGDLTVNHSDVKVEGAVNGYITVGAGDVKVEGSVSGNIQVDVGDVLVRGEVKGSVNTSVGDIKR